MPVDSENFGASVGISGDLAVIGAPGHAANTGRAFIFRRSALGTPNNPNGLWEQEDILTAS